MSTFSLIMPAFNEANNIRRTIETLLKEISPNYACEFIIVDDGSHDDTARIVSEYVAVNPRVRLVQNGQNMGKGRSLINGTRAAVNDYAVFYDADMEITVETLKEFMEYIVREQPDAVIGSKLHPESRVEYSLMRRAFSQGYYLMIKTLFQMALKDTQTGIKAFRTTLIQNCIEHCTEDRFTFDIEMLYLMHRHGVRIEELPVEIVHQQTNSSIHWDSVLSMFISTLKLFFKMRIHWTSLNAETWSEFQDIR